MHTMLQFNGVPGWTESWSPGGGGREQGGFYLILVTWGGWEGGPGADPGPSRPSPSSCCPGP